MIFLEEILEEGHLLHPSIQGDGYNGTGDGEGEDDVHAKKTYFYAPYHVDFNSE